MNRLVIELCAAILIACAAYVVGHGHGRQVEQVKRAESVVATQTEIDRRDSASAEARITMSEYLGISRYETEARTHDAVERIRTIYRDSPATCVAVRPLGVQAELDAARERANAAARGVRSTDAKPFAARP